MQKFILPFLLLVVIVILGAVLLLFRPGDGTVPDIDLPIPPIVIDRTDPNQSSTSTTTAPRSTTTIATTTMSTINSTRIMQEWETYDNLAYSVYNEQFGATYAVFDGSLYVSILPPFHENRSAFETYLMDVTGQSLEQLCATSIYVYIDDEAGTFGTSYGEVGLSACEKQTF